MNGKIKNPTILCILDGWGISKIAKGNAVKLANTPNFDYLIDNYPNASLITYGPSVGLPENQVGNSEVGHMNLGAGRKIQMHLPRINHAFSKNFLNEDKKLNSGINKIIKKGGAIHIIGLCSEGGVHSHEDHIFKLIKYLKKRNLRVLLHMILDGRDTSQKNALNSLKKIKKFFGNFDLISSVSGRYFAMDRDQRWERTEKFYRTIVCKEGEKFDDLEVFIKEQYNKGITDEFIKPAVSRKYCGIKNKSDGVIFMNFRSDRMRQISHSLCDHEFKYFLTDVKPIFISSISLVSYSKRLEKSVKVLFPKIEIKNTIGDVLSKKGLKQLRLSETEKYAHVTYFFNCGNEKNLKGEDRKLVQSPKVKTYDLQPNMSIEKVTGHLINAIESMEYDFILVNFANPDMVGHTGNLNAAVKACESVDNAIGNVFEKVKKINANTLIVADHGNCEEMINFKTDQPHTAHTSNLVPIVLITEDQNLKIENGILSDIAPTLLDLMKISKPKEMTGISLLKK
ncbi:MAG: 2,3-bisphosphoglycerate-independent phosphoglycerate mutase [Paracoccaceae bacterium]